MDKFFYPSHPVRCKFTGPSECGKSYSLTNLLLINLNENEKYFIYSPSYHQDLYHKIFKCFSDNIPINIIPNNLNEEYLGLVIDETVNDKDFEKRDTETETYESIEEMKYPHA